VYDNEGSQMYLGVRGEGRKADAAVAKTRGQVCVYDDGLRETLFCTYYSSTCGGRSQPVRNFKPNDPDVPPLRGDVVCTDCYLARFYRWDPLELSKAELTRRIVARYPSVERLGMIVGLRPKATSSDGRLIRIQLDGATGQNETLVGEDFRLSVGGRSLKSTRFDIETGRDHFIFKNGQGYGHGVGLCQNGMETKACRGMGYGEILATYYPTSKIATLYQ
jgi:stage II sporulation protein D